MSRGCYTLKNGSSKNNPLYNDVIIDKNDQLSNGNFIRVSADEELIEDNQTATAYMHINEASRIIRASWRFHIRICWSTMLYNGPSQHCQELQFFQPKKWTTVTLDANMIEGDRMYKVIKILSDRNPNAYPIDANGYMEVQNLDAIKRFDNVRRIISN
ncbi:hypothetical protein AVEN_86492-1 [Araneus ventricosus]|uniref:Uncharacterized protein n=1 Tax=Araneus ventricosus TaxID=182803 RepID=A0A4Y2QSD9_ARAVE|nr:hypothetical protein AVEN_86492-1 [Araneus ventricosus]